MKLLVLGGTSFVGRHLVDAATAAGHEVELFHRGRTGPGLFPDLVHHRGDRDNDDYDALRTGTWDVVADVTAYVPHHVEAAADVLLERSAHCVLISTVSVYDASLLPVGGGEDSPRLAPVRSRTGTREEYGALKVACEDDAAERWGDRLTVVRPGVVAGPHDPTGRFTWWVEAVADRRPLRVPRVDQPVQVVDARDLAAFTVAAAEQRLGGPVDVVGAPTTLQGLASACAEAAGAAPLLGSGDPEGDVPLLLPTDGSWDSFMTIRGDRAAASGLVRRPLSVTARDTLHWVRAT